METRVPTLNLSISSYPDRIAGLFHFLAEDESGCKGFGTDSVVAKALLKAATECAERHVMKSLAHIGPQTSSGFAGHSELGIARQKASLELIERDAFLLGWVSGTAPEWLSERELLKQSNLISKILNGLTVAGFHHRIGLVARTGDVFTAVGVLQPSSQNDLDFGAVLGSAAGLNVESCIESVCYELARAGTVILNRKEKLGTIFTADSKLPNDGRSTFDYYLDPSHSKEIEFYFEAGSTLSLPNPKIVVSEYERQIADPELKLHIARAECRDIQPLFFGFVDDAKINIKRFEACGLSVKTSAVMPLP